MTCCKLHNFIIDNGGGATVPLPSRNDNNGHSEPADYTVHLQDDCGLDVQMHRRRCDLDTSALREHMTHQIHVLVGRRP